MGKRIYAETTVRAPMDLLWQRTQCPAQHSRWDLRFGEIRALATAQEGLQRFRYATTVFPGLTVAGIGVHSGEQRRPDGSCTSALRFSSTHPLSIIRAGSGYWRYRPGDGIVFLTGYDYRPGWGRLGPPADAVVFRPLIGWATAWSFDRLRLWCELDQSPERSRNQALAGLAIRAGAVAAALVMVTSGRRRRSPVVVLARGSIALALIGAALALPPRSTTPAARRTRRSPAALHGPPADHQRHTRPSMEAAS
ncbi:hypothetical protein [Bogoriella caseilytica]|uniref:Polyketide cyclase/dehydrase/lipid transport protein n=1 Tax=Bogoriella caseilytica TaxID=56055 RepID=A0A3N2BC36_9MICO|nr:hypothetical protein [Bogoriella caseilytica]ROR72805.1 hypothetical protein EDD31_1165 [Bogoriella caseilytica]